MSKLEQPTTSTIMNAGNSIYIDDMTERLSVPFPRQFTKHDGEADDEFILRVRLDLHRRQIELWSICEGPDEDSLTFLVGPMVDYSCS